MLAQTDKLTPAQYRIELAANLRLMAADLERIAIDLEETEIERLPRPRAFATGLALGVFGAVSAGLTGLARWADAQAEATP